MPFLNQERHCFWAKKIEFTQANLLRCIETLRKNLQMTLWETVLGRFGFFCKFLVEKPTKTELVKTPMEIE